MELHGPRAVIPSVRRVCLPKKLAAPLGLVAGEYADVRLAPKHSGELLVTAAGSPSTHQGARDPHRPRRLTALAQLSVPAVLLDAVGVTPEEPWVYFAPTEDGQGLRMIPAVRVDARVRPVVHAEVMT